MGGGGITEGWPYVGQIWKFATTILFVLSAANLRLGTEVGGGQPDLEEFLVEEQSELPKREPWKPVFAQVLVTSVC